MLELQELVCIVARERLKKIEILNNMDIRKGSKDPVSLMYHGILSGEIKTDKDACAILKYKEGGAKYRSFKSRMLDKLHNSTFFLDALLPERSEYYTASYRCSTAQHVVRILTWLSARSAATKLSERRLADAIKYEMAEMAVFFLRSLVQKAADTERKHDFYKYSAMLDFWWQRWLAEEQAIMAYFKMQAMYAETIAPQPEAGKLALEAATKIEQNLHVQDSFILRLHLYRLKGHGMYILGRYSESMAAWTTLDKYMDKHPVFVNNIRRGEVALQQITSCIHLQDYEAGKALASDALAYFQHGTINRVILYETFFPLLMHGGWYKEAGDLYAEAMKEIKFKELPAFQQEKWKLFEGYLYLVLGNIPGHSAAPFKIAKFMNEAHKLSADKKGANLSLLILEICLLMKERINLMKEEINDRRLAECLEALKRYQGRYLRKAGSKRMRIFVNLLLMAAKYDYDTLKKRSALLHKKLISIPFRYSGSFEGIEVLRLEQLWDRVKQYAKERWILSLTADLTDPS